MAGIISPSSEPKYGAMAETPRPDEGEALKKEKFQWARNYKIQTGGKNPYCIPHPVELYPKVLQLVRGKKVYDLSNYMTGGLAISQRLKDAIEDIEPGVHQFIPFELLNKDGSPYEAQFYFYNICTEVDAVNPVLGGLEQQFYVDDPQKRPDCYHWKAKPGYKNLAVFKDRIAGRAMWTDCRYVVGHFFSEALLTRMRTDGMEGWRQTSYWEEL